MWRYRSDHRNLPSMVAFRFDYVIEADVQHAEALIPAAVHNESTRAVLQRRADGYFPPMMRTVWINEDLQPIEDASLIGQLDAPYRKMHGDVNLRRARIEWFEHVFGHGRWEELIPAARARSEEVLHSNTDLTRLCSEARVAAEARMETRLDILRVRSEQDTAGFAEMEELTLEEGIARTISQGISNPLVRVDSVGLVILSGERFGE